jgi:hypothetical protein
MSSFCALKTTKSFVINKLLSSFRQNSISSHSLPASLFRFRDPRGGVAMRNCRRRFALTTIIGYHALAALSRKKCKRQKDRQPANNSSTQEAAPPAASSC